MASAYNRMVASSIFPIRAGGLTLQDGNEDG